MAVLQGSGQNLPSPCVCYPKDPMWNRVNCKSWFNYFHCKPKLACDNYDYMRTKPEANSDPIETGLYQLTRYRNAFPVTLRKENSSSMTHCLMWLQEFKSSFIKIQ